MGKEQGVGKGKEETLSLRSNQELLIINALSGNSR